MSSFGTNSSSKAWRMRSRWLWGALLVHLLLGGTYLAILPLWGAVPDEPLHYSRIKYEAEIGGWPLITDPRNWGEPLWVYCFTADPVGTGQHGPLFYTPAVPIYKATEGLTVQQQLYVLRVYSWVWGALSVVLAWLLLGELFPQDEALAGLALLAVTLSPHRLMLSAVIYNDIACIAATFGFLWLLLRAARLSGGSDSRRAAWGWAVAGAGLGIAYLAKTVALVTLPAALYLLVVSARGTRWDMRRLGVYLGCFLGGLCLVGGPWLLRQWMIYGQLFPAEPAWVQHSWGQLLTTVPGDQLLWMAGYVLRGFWLSLWSQVGWLPFDGPTLWPLITRCIYGGLLLLSAFTLLGFVVGWKRRWRDTKIGSGPGTRSVALTFFLALAGMVYGAQQWVLLVSFHSNEETGKHAQVIFVGLVFLLILAGRQFMGQKGGRYAVSALITLLVAFNLGSIVWLETDLIPKYAPPTPALGLRRVQDLPSGRAPGIWHRYRVPGVQQEGGLVPRPANAKAPTTRANPLGLFSEAGSGASTGQD